MRVCVLLVLVLTFVMCRAAATVCCAHCRVLLPTDLQDLSKDDWMNIPDANDISHKRRKTDKMKELCVPTSNP